MEDLPIRILKHLKNSGATYQKIEIGFPFLEDDDSTAIRQELRHALDYLVRENFIVLDGRPIEMLSKQAGAHPSKYHTGLKATITKLGEKEIEPQRSEPKQLASHYIHMENVTNPIVNSAIVSSNLESGRNSNNTLANTQTIPPTVNTQKTSWLSKILKWLIKNIWQIFIGVLIIAIAYYLGFTKSH